MNLALWIVASVLAASFAGSGLMKLLVPKDKLVSSGQGWAQDVTPTNIRLIGVVEVLGAAGLILPAVTHIAPILVPLAATLGPRDGRRGSGSRSPQRGHEHRGQCGAAGAGCFRCMGQVRAVPVGLTLLQESSP
jgi:hypothetical protein